VSIANATLYRVVSRPAPLSSSTSAVELVEALDDAFAKWTYPATASLDADIRELYGMEDERNMSFELSDDSVVLRTNWGSHHSEWSYFTFKEI